LRDEDELWYNTFYCDYNSKNMHTINGWVRMVIMIIKLSLLE
jgi:hypothetical protein